MHKPTDTVQPAPPTSLGPLLALTFVSSMGTGLATTGIFFMTRHAYGFSDVANYGLGVVMGLTYLIAASVAHHVTTSGIRQLGSTRAVLATVLVLLGLVCFIPLTGELLPGGRLANRWLMWVFVCVYSTLTGTLWPIIESFTSGGRRGAVLRRTMGIWNTTWCGALIATYLLMAPLVEQRAVLALTSLGVVHLASTLLLLWFGREPGDHDVHGEPHPAIYERLLPVFRLLLPASYVLLSTLSPFLPSALGKFGVSPAWQVRMVAVLLLARTATFFVFGAWHGWHGRWWPPLVGAAAILAGFAGAVLVPRFMTGSAGIAAELAALSVLGIGMAVIYSGAVYYAMEVGSASVDAGGTHEALIGLGYTMGPLVPFVALIAVQRGTLAMPLFEPVVVGCAFAIAAAVAIFAAAKTARSARLPNPAAGDT